MISINIDLCLVSQIYRATLELTESLGPKALL